MQRRAAIIVTSGLAGCGGGARAECAPRLFSIYGDSTTSGSYSATPQAAERSYLTVRPVARIAQALGQGWAGIDRSIPGWGVFEHRQGWPSTMQMDPAEVVVLRFGGADSIARTHEADFEVALRLMAGSALWAGKRVVLAGIIRMARRPEWQDPIGLTADVYADREAHSARLDAVVRRVAASVGLRFVDVRALPFYGAADIADAVHPAQAYADRCADAVAACLASMG